MATATTHTGVHFTHRQLASADSLTVAGLVRLSTVDWPGRMVSTIFLQGCPWNCIYCHNPDLIDCRTSGIMAWADVETFLQRRQGLLDGVVFTGGEPTRQRGLMDAMERAHTLGFQCGLHTMGAYPTLLRPLLPLIDWVGFDIKAAPTHYGSIIATDVRSSIGTVGSRHAMESLDMLLDAGMAYRPALPSTRTLLPSLIFPPLWSCCSVKAWAPTGSNKPARKGPAKRVRTAAPSATTDPDGMRSLKR